MKSIAKEKNIILQGEKYFLTLAKSHKKVEAVTVENNGWEPLHYIQKKHKGKYWIVNLL